MQRSGSRSSLNFADLARILSTRSSLADRADLVLEWLLQAGYSRARFYEIVPAPVGPGFMVLTQAIGHERHAADGYEIPLEEASFVTCTPGTVRETAVHELAEPLPSWVSDLDLQDSLWVDMPLPTHTNPQVVFSFDRPVGTERRGPSDDEFLVLTTLLAPNSLHPVYPGGSPASTGELLPPARDANEGIDRLLNQLQSALEPGALALFTLDLQSAQLRKTNERIHSDFLINDVETFPEVYPWGDPSLTASAFLDPSYRYISKFERLSEEDRSKANVKSVSRHEQLFNGKTVRSVIYRRFGGTRHHYLLRAINRGDAPLLPFTRTHLEIVDAVVDAHAPVIDFAVQNERVAAFGKLAQGASHRAAVDSFVREIQGAIGLEGVDAALLVVWDPIERDPGRSIIYQRAISPWHNYEASLLETFKDTLSVGDLHSFLNEAVDPASGIADIRNRPSRLGRMLRRAVPLSHAALVASASVGSMTGLILVPTRLDIQSLSGTGIPLSGIRSTLESLAGLATAALAAHQEGRVHDAALEAVSLTFHEIGGPAIAVRDLGDRALEVLRPAGSETIEPEDQAISAEQMDEIVAELHGTVDDIDTLLSLAGAFSEVSAPSITVDFEELDLNAVLHSSYRTSLEQNQAEIRAGRRPAWTFLQRPIVTVLEPSAVKIVADHGLLRRLFLNIFSNAFKYSLPRDYDDRRRRLPIEVQVSMDADDERVIIDIENWGLGVAAEDRRVLTNPYVRAVTLDDRKAIRGLGLGLYLANQCALAHEGFVECLSSEPTLSEARTRKMEGFITTFRIQLSRHLTPGVQNVETSRGA